MTVNFNLGFVADAAGTVDAITATYTPTYTVLLDKMLVWFRATGANTITNPTFSPNGLTARTIVKQGGQPLVAGDIPRAGAIMEMVYDATNTRWELVNPAHVGAYKRYVALLTQTSTNAPTAIVIENTLGGTIVWSYDAVGQYIGTLSGAFTVNKTLIFIGSPLGGFNVFNAYYIDTNTIMVQSYSVTDPPQLIDVALGTTPIEIRVYP